MAVVKLIKDCGRILSNVKQSENQPNVLSFMDPLTIIGDIHGQFYDFLKILQIGGNPQTQKFLFLGDYVDRGSFSIEVIILLFSLKINFPKTIYLLRGNHQCRQMTTFFNFKDQCNNKYDQEIFQLVMDLFDCLPLACIVNNRFFAVHGGISPDLKSIDDVKKFNRFIQPPRQGLICDLLWADPVDAPDGTPFQTGMSQQQFRHNQTRGCSYYYNFDSVKAFNQRNNLMSVIRAHQAQPQGFKMYKWGGVKDFPCIITIFSAPNYCDVYNNKGAVIKFKNNTLNIQQFNYTQHPYLLPNFLDVFSWSLPFVGQKVTEMFYHMLKPKDQQKDKQTDQQFHIDPQRKGTSVLSAALKNKIRAISKILLMQRVLREQSENIMQLKGLCPDRLPPGILLQGKDAIQNAIAQFQKAKKSDLINQRRPQSK